MQWTRPKTHYAINGRQSQFCIKKNYSALLEGKELSQHLTQIL